MTVSDGALVDPRDGGARTLKFQTVADNLRRGILAGTWALGDRLPTEQQLMTSTGYSLNTVRRAVEELEAEGLVERRQGAGTFVVLQRRTRPRSRANIGVLLPDTRLYYPRVLQGIESALTAEGASLQLATYNYDPRREDDCIERLLSAEVDGLLLVPTFVQLTSPQDRAEQLMALPVPVVLLERSLMDLGPGDETEHVCSDHQAGAHDAVRYLNRLGHRRIALLLRGRSNTGFAVQHGYSRAISSLQLPEIPIFKAEYEEWEARRAEDALDALQTARATAALVFGDREATLLEGAARRRGLRVPEDLALVSYDDETADIAEVPLTAVAPPKHRIGRMAAQILLQRLAEGEACPIHQIRIRPRIVVRESCGAKRGPNPSAAT
ncbi:GntR family transcriptional regulator [Occultella gossypii]|uniref:GntR family transcriptional regulator n=1 Tax=Occultella gossypii TaxID=2800820 RepID=UPI001CBD3358|nr:substrate-binding domain-containing protein [Occultella gossypii]